MKAASFEYFRPQTLAEACLALEEHPNARLIAGGQTLVPMMAMRLARPSLLVDIYRLEELAGITLACHHVEIGACTRQADAEKNAVVQQHLPLLAKALPWVGHQPTRNRGTIGGSIANADSSAEIPLVLVTLEGEADTVNADGDVETIHADELFIGPMLTTIPEDSCLKQIRFPVWQNKAVGSGFCEISARRSDFAFASAAGQVSLAEDGTCLKAALGVGGIDDTPIKLDVSELEGAKFNPEVIREIVASLISEIESFEDLHASATYRKRAARELSFRALYDAWHEAALNLQGESN